MDPRIREIAFFCHPVADIARARAFYGTALGLKVLTEIEFQPGAWWIEYDVAGVALAVTNALPPSANPAGPSIAFEVEDFDRALACVKASGIALTIEPQDYPPCRMFAVSSPDGHAIIFHKRKS